MNSLTTFILCLATALPAKSVVTDSYVAKVGFIESSNRPGVVGDAGRSVGQYQMSKDAWIDAQRACPSLAVYSYTRHAKNEPVARLVAKAYLSHIESRLKSEGVANPTPIQVYMAYNMGVSGARKFGFNPASNRLSTGLQARYRRISAQLAR